MKTILEELLEVAKVSNHWYDWARYNYYKNQK